jgi:hypothetical protein
MTSDDRLCLNGIDATTGGYLVPRLTVPEAAALIRGTPSRDGTLPDTQAVQPDPGVATWLRRVWRILSQPHLGLPLDVDPAKVSQAGWAIVFHDSESDAVKRALQPLIEHRRTQVPSTKCHVLTYQTGQTRQSWLAGNGVSAGSVLPSRVPYYLLLVGGPERFPFSFCHQLDVEYAVGCLQFDTPAEYERYARSVVEYEKSVSVPTARAALFFGTRHDGDAATHLSADQLVTPVAAQPLSGMNAKRLIGAEARKQALIDSMMPRGGPKPPAIVFTASHGMGWKQPDPRQPREQGALICQDWTPFTPPRPDDCFAAADVPADGQVHGQIAFHFACYGVGTPANDRFLHKKGQAPPVIAERPFLAALPKALLAHPRGGALAVIGHVERAWGYSIATPQAGAQLLPFWNTLERLAQGQPVGHAVKDFNERYAALSTSLTSMLEEIGFGAFVEDAQLARAWVEHNDAEGYVVVGDPAVALRVGDMRT